MKPSKHKILIIEDEKPLARALELKLTHEGFDVVSLSNGEDVISTIEKEKFAFIVSDLMMPKVDGFQVLELLKKENKKIPVIILTNLSQAEDEKRVRDLGAVEFFVKSNTPLAKIVEYIKQKVDQS
jgi:DNA-binding response OmpR family regulator